MWNRITPIAILLSVLGCQVNGKSLEDRLKTALEFNRRIASARLPPVKAKFTQDIISSLTQSDAKTLKKPRIASAIIARGTNVDFALYVFWVEDIPSIEDIEFRYSNVAPPVQLSIPLDYFKENTSSAKDTVVYRTVYRWKDESDISKTLERDLQAGELKVRLLRSKTAVTEWFPVDFFRANRRVE